MKANQTITLPVPSRFQPFNLTLTVETAEEARALYAIFNYLPNEELLSNVACIEIRACIGHEFLGAPSSGIIARGVTQKRFYCKKHLPAVTDSAAYHIICKNHRTELCEEVNGYLQAGWELVGAATPDKNGDLVQTVVKRSR